MDLPAREPPEPAIARKPMEADNVLICGFRRKVVPLRQVACPCSHCGRRSTVHTLVVERGKITVFFVPLIPIATRYWILCNLCGLRLKAVGALKEQLKGLERSTRPFRVPQPAVPTPRRNPRERYSGPLAPELGSMLES